MWWPKALVTCNNWLEIRLISAWIQTHCHLLTLRIKVHCARHLSGSWVLAVSGPGSSSTWSLRGGQHGQQLLVCLFCLPANACKSSCQVHWITIRIQLSVFHSPVIYPIVYFHSSTALSPSLLLTGPMWASSFDIWLILWMHCIFRWCLLLLCFWFNMKKTSKREKWCFEFKVNVYYKGMAHFPWWLLFPLLKLKNISVHAELFPCFILYIVLKKLNY